MQTTESTDETQPMHLTEDKPPVPQRRLPGFLVGLFAIILLVLVTVASAYGGYQQGLEDRIVSESTKMAGDIDRQFELGMEDFENREFERARQRFEYVLSLNPNYPGAIEMLAQALSVINATATPTAFLPSPTPTLTPTPDLRTVQEKYEQAVNNVANQQWETAIETLLSLRREDPNYQAVRVDSLLYVSYRNLGAQKITMRGLLEPGLYDLAQAELFGPLDVEAQNFRDWARFYLIGASFWQVDWGQAAYYFGQIALSVPNLHDGTNWTAAQRYREALLNYSEQLAANEDWCNAEIQYNILFNYTGDQQLQPTITWVYENCNPPAPPEDTPTPTLDPALFTPTPTPTPTPAVEETPTPSPTEENGEGSGDNSGTAYP